MLVRIGAGERVSKLTHLTMGHTGVSVVHVSTSCLDFDLIIVHRDVLQGRVGIRATLESHKGSTGFIFGYIYQIFALYTRQIGVKLVRVVLRGKER